MADAEQLLKRAHEYIDVHEEGFLALLRRLVRHRSLPGKEGSAGDGDSVVATLHDEIGRGSTDLHVQTVTPGSDNLIEVLRGAGRGGLILEGHTDIVGAGDVGDWHAGDPYGGYEGEVEYLGDRQIKIHVEGATYDGEIRDRMARVWETRGEPVRRVVYGRGAFDNKGPVVAVFAAIRALEHVLGEEGLRLGGDLLGAYCVREETDGAGAKAFAAGEESWLAQQGYVAYPDGRPAPADGLEAVVLEGSYGYVPIVGHRGSIQFLVKATGRAAHGATPHLGVNAVLTVAELLTRLEQGWEELERRLGVFAGDEVLGPWTAAVGTTIVGGGINQVAYTADGAVVDRESVNAIPSWCEASLDVRYPTDPGYPTETPGLPQHVLDTYRRYIDEIMPPDAAARITLEKIHADLPCVLGRTWTDAEQHPLVTRARRATTPLLGYDPGIGVAPGGTDATFIIHGSGIDTLIEFGPAGGLSHQPHEFVERNHIAAGAKILATMAVDKLGIEGA